MIIVKLPVVQLYRKPALLLLLALLFLPVRKVRSAVVQRIWPKKTTANNQRQNLHINSCFDILASIATYLVKQDNALDRFLNYIQKKIGLLVTP